MGSKWKVHLLICAYKMYYSVRSENQNWAFWKANTIWEKQIKKGRSRLMSLKRINHKKSKYSQELEYNKRGKAVHSEIQDIFKWNSYSRKRYFVKWSDFSKTSCQYNCDKTTPFIFVFFPFLLSPNQHLFIRFVTLFEDIC